MSHLVIDQELCTKCNRCVQDCPMGIPMENEEGVYTTNTNNADICIYCGHCVSVCPVEALRVNGCEKSNQDEMDNYGIINFDINPEDCEKSRLKEIPLQNQMEALIVSRRMTRSFKKEMVDKETINHIFNDVLKYAATGHNCRGFKATVVEGREKLATLTDLTLENFQQLLDDNVLHSFDQKVFQRIIEAWADGYDRIFRTGQQVVVISCKTSIVPADPAVKVMLTYFEALCRTMGIGTVWAGYFMVAANYPPIKKFLGLAEDESVYGAMIFGYPEFEYDLIPKRPEIDIKYL